MKPTSKTLFSIKRGLTLIYLAYITIGFAFFLFLLAHSHQWKQLLGASAWSETGIGYLLLCTAFVLTLVGKLYCINTPVGQGSLVASIFFSLGGAFFFSTPTFFIFLKQLAKNLELERSQRTLAISIRACVVTAILLVITIPAYSFLNNENQFIIFNLLTLSILSLVFTFLSLIKTFWCFQKEVDYLAVKSLARPDSELLARLG